MNRIRLGLAALMSTGMTSVALSQCTPGGPMNPAATPRTITGIVMDSAHVPLENAIVKLVKPRREVRTNANGIFRLTDLDTGTYELTVRRIGYDMAVQRYIVPDSGGVARFCLFLDITALPAIVTSAPRGGIQGVVGDTALALVRGAEVRLLGENQLTYSDSAGGFFFPAKPGPYSIAVKKEGYGTQVVGVTVPKDSGRKIVVWLGSPPRNPNQMALAIEGMRWNILMTPSFRYHRVMAEELARSELSVEQLIRVRGRANVQDDCEAHIAGTNFSLPIYMLDKSEITMIEIVEAPLTARGGDRGVTSINGNASIATQGRGTAMAGQLPPQNCPGIVAWMKP